MSILGNKLASIFPTIIGDNDNNRGKKSYTDKAENAGLWCAALVCGIYTLGYVGTRVRKLLSDSSDQPNSGDRRVGPRGGNYKPYNRQKKF